MKTKYVMNKLFFKNILSGFRTSNSGLQNYKTKSSHRIIAVFFTLTFLQTLIPYNQIWANDGPIAPEAASFEPVDAVDMVDLLSGDFSYALPILNIPSPEGGYPLALSYHSGIAVDQEASWVGLGWNINPGAINRSVVGVPDDWQKERKYKTIYDRGGSIRSISGGIGLGWDRTVSLGLYASHVRNKTFGGETSSSFDAGVAVSVAGLVNAKLGTDESSLGMFGAKISDRDGASYGISKYGVGLSYDTTDGFSASADLFSIRQNGQNNVGISLSSKGGIGISTFGNGGSIGGSNSGGGSNKLASINDNFRLSISVWAININFSYSYLRYWYFGHNYDEHFGLLYANQLGNEMDISIFPEKIGLDAYNSIYEPNLDRQIRKGTYSYLSYDRYGVSAQGLSGNIKPNILESGTLKMLNQSINNQARLSYLFPDSGNDNRFRKKISNVGVNDIHFYFENEHASYINISNGIWDKSKSIPANIANFEPKDYSFDHFKKINGITYSGYNFKDGKKLSGSYIEVLTNKQIIESPGSIITPKDFERNSDLVPDSGIGAYKITTYDGKTYHYNIPVYQRETTTVSTDLDKSFDNSYVSEQQVAPYATHWLLTAITGPDYIDINNNGELDANDYGYWVEFEYGKWSDGYVWRSPYSGYKSNDQSKFYQYGIKDLYYLDAVRTRTHTALFIKDTRNDNYAFETSYSTDVSVPFKRSFVKGSDGGVYADGAYDRVRVDIYGTPYPNLGIEEHHKVSFHTNEHKVLKLDKILLFKNDDIPANLSKHHSYNSGNKYSGSLSIRSEYYIKSLGVQIGSQFDDIVDRSWGGEYYSNVYDINDFSTNLEGIAQSSYHFNYDYTLAKGSPNTYSEYGRLTLKSFLKKGHQGKSLVPPYKFEYQNGIYTYSADKEDNWGYYENAPDTWSLNKVTTPTGGEMILDYEADDINRQAVSSAKRVFDSGLNLNFKISNNNIYIDIENEPSKPESNKIDFRDFFKTGNYVIPDIWACFRHEYRDFTCFVRKGSIDYSNKDALITSVTQDKVTIYVSNNNGLLQDDNGGLYWLCNPDFKLNYVLSVYPERGEVPIRKERGHCPEDWSSCKNRIKVSMSYTLVSNKTDLAEKDKKGGGIRVDKITVRDNGNQRYESKYDYNMPDSSSDPSSPQYVSSGVTSYVPQKYNVAVDHISELPPPSVMYEYITVSNGLEPYQTKNRYRFEVLKSLSKEDNISTLGDAFKMEKIQDEKHENNSSINLSKFKMTDHSAIIGRLLSKTTYNSKSQIISKQINNYKTIAEIKQGIVGESFNTYKKITEVGGSESFEVNTSSKVMYPNVLKSITNLQNGLSTTTRFTAHDFLTGKTLETETELSDGTSLKNVIIPAYTKYSTMAEKASFKTYKNMLTQEAATYNYIKKGDDEWNAISAYVTTWGNHFDPAHPVWRKHINYIWKGPLETDGTYKNFSPFSWDQKNPQDMTKWQKILEITKYDNYSRSLETMDINGNKIATKMGDNDTKIFAVGNAGYNEIFYSGAESNPGTIDFLEGGVITANQSTRVTHTGKYAVTGYAGKSAFSVKLKENEHRAGRYKISVWVERSNNSRAKISINGDIKDFNGEKVQAANWIQMNHYEDFTTSEVNVSVVTSESSGRANLTYDDFRMHPVASSMTSYVYNQWDELTYILGSNNLATKYEYDEAGRLSKTYIEVIDVPGKTGGFKKTNAVDYNYKK